jgi:TonB family protein
MHERALPFSRIRAPRGSDPRTFTAESHRDCFLQTHDEPLYPVEAIARGVEGDVMLNVVVDREGRVLEASAAEGDPVLASAAIDAVRTWTYRPTKLNGIPVEVKTDVRFRFRLPDVVVWR